MNITSLKTHQAAVEAKQAALQQFHAGRQRAIEAMNQGDQHASEIASLKQQRTDALGAAFVRQEQASTAHLDKAISAAEKRHAEALATAEAARAALVLLDQQIEDARAELADLQREQMQAALTAADAAHADAQAAYLAQADQLLDALAQFEASATVRDALAARLGQRSDLVDRVRRLVRDKLELPTKDRGGAWVQTGEPHTRWGRHLPVIQNLIEQLRDVGVEAHGASLAKPAQPAQPITVTADPVVRVTQTAWQPGQVHLTQPDARIGLVSQQVR
jgi:chromosome segregation ATPase